MSLIEAITTKLDLIQKIIRYANIFLCIAGFSLVIGLGYIYNQDKQHRETIAFEKGQEQAISAAKRINDEMTEQMDIATRLADDLTNGTLSYEALTERLREETRQKPTLFGIGVAFVPFGYKPDVKLYAPYYRKNEADKFERVQVENSYDYTDKSNEENSAWFYNTLEKGAHWYQSPYDVSARAILVEYYAPFYRLDPKTSQKIPAGVVYVDHSTETLKTFMRSINFGEEGYSFIFTDKGNIVVHPKPTLVNHLMTEAAEILGDPNLSLDAPRAIQGESFYREHTTETGDPAWTFYQPLVAKGWSVGVVAEKNAYSPPPERIIRNYTNFSLAVMAWFIFLLAYWFRLERGSEFSLWGIAIGSALILSGGVIWMWYILQANPVRNSDETVLVNATHVDDRLSPVEKTIKANGQPDLIRVPTGVMLRNVTLGINETTITGYIWQKYPVDLPENIVKEIIFPDDTAGATIQEVYRFQKGSTETIGWFFIATLRQSFNVSNYPLDQATARLRIWPSQLNQNVVFVPDFNEYTFMAPSQKPGLAPDLSLSDWLIRRSFFSYQFEDYNATFGGVTETQRNILPTLVFNVNATRTILSPVIAFCITVLVVAGLMFGSLCVDLESAYGALANASGQFFVIAVTHVGLRSSLNAGGVVYLEYFFIVLYIYILAGGINGAIYYSEVDIKLVQYKNNLLAKLTFLPSLAGILLLITLYIFYPRAIPAEAFSLTETAATPITAQEIPTPIVETPLMTTTLAVSVPVTAVTPEIKSVAVTSDSVTLHFLTGEPTTLDPSLANTQPDQIQIANLFSGLTRLDSVTNLPLPNLAITWTTSTDGMEWTFNLRHDVAWVQYDPKTQQVQQAIDFQGQPRFVTAHDVVYGVKRTLESGNSSAVLLYAIKNAQDDPQNIGAEAIDDWTVKFTLIEPTPYFATLMANNISFPVPRWSIEEWADEWTEPDKINTNGPYLLAENIEGERIQLIKNPFWVNANKVQIEVITELYGYDQNVIDMYRNNELDIIDYLNAEEGEIEDANKDATLKPELTSSPLLCTDYFGFINNKPPFNDKRVRRAFSAAIDREAIVKARGQGEAIATTFGPPGVFGAVLSDTVGQGYDPDLARTLFAAYLKDGGFTVEEFNTAYPLVLHGDNVASQMAIADWQKNLGVVVTNELVSEEELATRQDPHAPLEEAFPIFQLSWCADYPDQNNFLYNVFNSEHGENWTRRNCADATCETPIGPNEFDRLTLQAAHSLDPNERQALYTQAEQILAVDEAAYAPLFHEAAISLNKPWLTRNHPATLIPDFENWQIDVASQKQ